MAAAFACTPAPARVEYAADSAAGEIDFQLAGPGGAALLVPVHVNGDGPFEFILDTGATLTCVSQRLADSLALPARRAPGAVGVGVGGTGALRLAQVDSLRVGASRAVELPVCVIDLDQTRIIGAPVDGLLGLNFLREFRVALDFERRVLRLEE